MPLPACSDSEFIGLFKTLGSAAAVARELGQNVRSVQRRRDRLKVGAASAQFAPQKEQTICVIPDIQAKPGIDLSYLECISRYIEDKRPDVVMNLGDMADMPSLSSYDRGKKQFEGRRYKHDIEAAIEANERLWAHVKYQPETHILYGNHENRIVRAVDDDAKLDGVMGLHDLQYEKYYQHVHPFLKVVKVAGIAFSHYFYTPNSGKPYGGTAHTKLKNVGMSFVQGHQQGLDVALRELPDGSQQIGIVAGSCYEHDEDYRGPQANGHWRGIVMLHECDGSGRADPMFVSLNFLRRRYA